MVRAGLASSSRSKKSSSTLEAFREYRLKFTPPSRGVAPRGELRPKSSVAVMGRYYCEAGAGGMYRLQNLENLFVAFEGRNQVRSGHFRARPLEHLARHLEAAVARRGTGRFHGLQKRFRNHDAGHLVVQTLGLLVAVQGPHADQHGNGGLAAEPPEESAPVGGVEKRLGHGKVRPGFDFR